MKKVESHQVPAKKIEVRLSDYVVGKFESITSKKGMKKAIIGGLVKINGEEGFTADYIRGGELIELYQAKPKTSHYLDMKLDIVYEDEYIAIIHKPAGIVVSGNKKRSIENALPVNLEPSSQIDALPRPDPAHRLDHPTSGALLIGKTRGALTVLNQMFEKREIKKTYHCITQGEMKEKSGQLDTVIKGKKATSMYKVIKTVDSPKFKFLNLVEVNPVTGRRHQIRIHMAGLGTPILGDLNYGIEGSILKGKGLFLHSSGMEFAHPLKDVKVNVTIALPSKFKKLSGFEEEKKKVQDQEEVEKQDSNSKKSTED